MPMLEQVEVYPEASFQGAIVSVIEDILAKLQSSRNDSANGGMISERAVEAISFPSPVG